MLSAITHITIKPIGYRIPYLIHSHFVNFSFSIFFDVLNSCISQHITSIALPFAVLCLSIDFLGSYLAVRNFSFSLSSQRASSTSCITDHQSGRMFFTASITRGLLCSQSSRSIHTSGTTTAHTLPTSSTSTIIVVLPKSYSYEQRVKSSLIASYIASLTPAAISLSAFSNFFITLPFLTLRID